MIDVKLLIVDDHPIFRDGIRMTVEKIDGIDVIGEAANGKEALEILSKQRVHVVLMDIKMPEMDGIEATRLIKSKYPLIHVIAITLFGEEKYVESMLEAGADAFILKNIDRNGLRKAIASVSDGKQYFSEELMPFFTNKFLGKDKASAINLTPREKEVLHFIAEGYTNHEIADKLNVSQRTVANHRANLLQKTETKNTATLLAFAIKNNLIAL